MNVAVTLVSSLIPKMLICALTLTNALNTLNRALKFVETHSGHTTVPAPTDIYPSTTATAAKLIQVRNQSGFFNFNC